MPHKSDILFTAGAFSYTEHTDMYGIDTPHVWLRPTLLFVPRALTQYNMGYDICAGGRVH